MVIQTDSGNPAAPGVKRARGKRSGTPEISKSSAEIEQALAEVKSELNQVLNNVGQGIRIINKDCTVRYINQDFARMSGMDAEKSVGRKCYDVFLGPFCHTPECRLGRILNGEKQVRIEIQRTRRDGTVIPCVVTAFPLKNLHGSIIGVVEIFQDITERLQLQEQAKESEEHYRALIDLGTKIGESIAMLQDIDGIEGKFVFVSDRWSKTIGYPKEDLLGMSVFQLIRPVERKIFLKRYRREKLGVSMAGLFELVMLRNDGVEVPVEITSAVTNYQGKLATVIYMRDITERKKAEEKLMQSENRYHSLFDHAPVAIWEMDYSDCKKYIDGLRKKGVEDITAYFEKNPDELIHAFELVRTIDVNNANVAMNGATSKDELVNNVNRSLINTPGALRDFAKNTMTLVRGTKSYVRAIWLASFRRAALSNCSYIGRSRV
jgi:PAS domain S-box-containing protein